MHARYRTALAAALVCGVCAPISKIHVDGAVVARDAVAIVVGAEIRAKGLRPRVPA